MPARPYRPRDKAKVESGVQLAQRWIIAVLRHHRFYSEADVNEAVRPLLTALNQRPFRQRDGSRHSQFLEFDKPALKPLPSEPFDLSEWAQARVNIDYHITFDGSLYRVPYNLVHELVEIHSTATTIEILHQGSRVSSHLRSRARGQAIRLTWKGLHRASLGGEKRVGGKRVRSPPNCSNGSWRISPTPRWDSERVSNRADAENRFDELNNQWGWTGYMTQDLKRSQLMARLVGGSTRGWVLSNTR